MEEENKNFYEKFHRNVTDIPFLGKVLELTLDIVYLSCEGEAKMRQIFFRLIVDWKVGGMCGTNPAVLKEVRTGPGK